jgi:hypothetical protein
MTGLILIVMGAAIIKTIPIIGIPMLGLGIYCLIKGIQ